MSSLPTSNYIAISRHLLKEKRIYKYLISLYIYRFMLNCRTCLLYISILDRHSSNTFYTNIPLKKKNLEVVAAIYSFASLINTQKFQDVMCLYKEKCVYKFYSLFYNFSRVFCRMILVSALKIKTTLQTKNNNFFIRKKKKRKRRHSLLTYTLSLGEFQPFFSFLSLIRRFAFI
jgi:hypothetical protein